MGCISSESTIRQKSLALSDPSSLNRILGPMNPTTVAMQVDVMFLGSFASSFMSVANSFVGGVTCCLKQWAGAGFELVRDRYSGQLNPFDIAFGSCCFFFVAGASVVDPGGGGGGGEDFTGGVPVRPDDDDDDDCCATDAGGDDDDGTCLCGDGDELQDDAIPFFLLYLSRQPGVQKLCSFPPCVSFEPSPIENRTMHSQLLHGPHVPWKKQHQETLQSCCHHHGDKFESRSLNLIVRPPKLQQAPLRAALFLAVLRGQHVVELALALPAPDAPVRFLEVVRLLGTTTVP